MLRVGLLTARGSRLGGGVASAVQALALALRKSGVIEPVVFTCSDESIEKDRANYEGIELVVCPQYGPRSFGFSPQMSDLLLSRNLDVLHLHGIWMHTSVAGHRWATATRKPYVISPHGMLEPWIRNHGRMKKWLAEVVYERASHRRANLIHALTVAEGRDIREFLPSAPIGVIPNGVKHKATSHAGASRNAQMPRFIYLGRLHEKKNVVGLVKGWLRAKEAVQARNAQLIIAGYGDAAYVEDVKRHVETANREVPVSFLGSVFGEAKDDLLASADYLVLPSHSEGLPMAVLEAWSWGTPTLITEFCNLPQAYEVGAAMKIGVEVDSIAEGIETALRRDYSQWEISSRAAHSLVADQFDEEAVLAKWVATYLDLSKVKSH